MCVCVWWQAKGYFYYRPDTGKNVCVVWQTIGYLLYYRPDTLAKVCVSGGKPKATSITGPTLAKMCVVWQTIGYLLYNRPDTLAKVCVCLVANQRLGGIIITGPTL